MDMRESPELTCFRHEVREWIQANVPPNPWGEPYRYEGTDVRTFPHEWCRILGQKGWLAYTWPKQYGGPGFSPAEQLVFEDECSRAGAPIPFGFGTAMIGPTLMQFGTEAQQQRFLPRIASHEEVWCQGYSEPNAGSDLASLQTRAELSADGNFFTVNGQKIWTSDGHHADWIFLLVRTDPGARKQKGISFLVADMKTPGITLRPIQQIDGGWGFNETFFEDVRVPAENLVGKLNDGWTVAKALLENERSSSGGNDVEAMLKRVRGLAANFPGQSGASMLQDGKTRQRLAQLEMDADCFRYTRFRVETSLVKGGTLGPEMSLLKLYLSELSQRVHQFGLDALGPDSAAWYDTRLPLEAYDMPMLAAIDRAFTIYSGSSEIQRTVIAKRVLGLPD
ncbi:MAG: acyl-CoA dehydrogenase family protein [Candidatus Lambdaproteobacteria bacterium]|nr:acyl-CoA dehydrogenase family protein [Candidatus Lambdaproteobacteria bacterium]